MSLYELEPSPPPGDRFRTLIVGSLLILALLVVVGGLFLLERSELAFAPTPTPTATDAPPIPPTADFRATRVVEDMITQEANPVVIDLGITPTAQTVVQAPEPDSTVLLTTTATVNAQSGQDIVQPTPMETPAGTITVSLSLPLVPAQSTPISIIPTPSATNPPLPTATPTMLPPTATVTQIPSTPTATITLTPLPTPYTVARIFAHIDEGGVKRQRGPSSHYEHDDEFEIGEIQLEGRSLSGEWVYASQDGNTGWLRQADALPLDDELPDNAPEGANRNDVGWLAVRPSPNENGVPPVPTPIPANDFPLERRNRSNQNWVNRIPLPPYNSIWPEGGYDAGQPFSSPVLVAGNMVIAANEDRHIYAVDRIGGNQKWRQLIDNRISMSPAIQDSTVYAIDELGVVYAIEESGIRWKKVTDLESIGSPTIAGDWLYVIGRNLGQPRLQWIRLDNGDIEQEFSRVSQEFHMPAIGDQMIYVAGDWVWAVESSVIEIEDEENQAQEIWRYNDFDGAKPSAPPVYSSPGVTSLAELYVGTGSGRIYLLNANTGEMLEWFEGDQAVRSLAIDGSRLYAAGDSRLRAYARDTRESLWNVELSAPIVSGPIADGDHVLVFLQDGTVEIFNAWDGERINNPYISRELQGGAVSNPYLFSASSDNKMYGLEGQN